jgi:hypothetical protein
MSRTEQFMRGFLTLKNAFGPKHAFAYWASVKDPAVTSDQLLSLFEKAWTAAAKAGKSTWTTPKRAERAAQKKPAEVGVVLHMLVCSSKWKHHLPARVQAALRCLLLSASVHLGAASHPCHHHCILAQPLPLP